MPPKTAHGMLEAGAGVLKERGEVYGPPSENFSRMSRLANAYLADKLKEPLTPADTSVLMALLKLSRLMQTPDHQDSWQDGINYLAIAGELALE